MPSRRRADMLANPESDATSRWIEVVRAETVIDGEHAEFACRRAEPGACAAVQDKYRAGRIRAAAARLSFHRQVAHRIAVEVPPRHRRIVGHLHRGAFEKSILGSELVEEQHLTGAAGQANTVAEMDGNGT